MVICILANTKLWHVTDVASVTVIDEMLADYVIYNTPKSYQRAFPFSVPSAIQTKSQTHHIHTRNILFPNHDPLQKPSTMMI